MKHDSIWNFPRRAKYRGPSHESVNRENLLLQQVIFCGCRKNVMKTPWMSWKHHECHENVDTSSMRDTKWNMIQYEISQGEPNTEDPLMSLWIEKTSYYSKSFSVGAEKMSWKCHECHENTMNSLLWFPYSLIYTLCAHCRTLPTDSGFQLRPTTLLHCQQNNQTVALNCTIRWPTSHVYRC